MTDVGLAIGFVLVLWWAGTAVVLYLDGLPRGTFRWSMLGATAVLALALYGIVATGHETTVSGALVSFACGVLAWGWQEMSFLTGFLTGPRRSACPSGCAGARHFLHGIEALLWHEFGIMGGAAILVALSWGEPNQVGLRTFLVLWGLRQSAKLNLFFGVPNPGEEYLPTHLRYLKSFFKRRPMNLLFPISITAATVFAAVLVGDSLSVAATPFVVAADILLATLTALGIVEHWLLVLPVRTSALWSWGMRSRERTLASSAAAPVDPAAGHPSHGAGVTAVVRSS